MEGAALSADATTAPDADAAGGGLDATAAAEDDSTKAANTAWVRDYVGTASVSVSTGLSGLGTGVAAFLADPTSAKLATAVVTTKTGSGSLVFATSPALDSPLPNAALPVGYAEDEAYLGFLERRILGALLAVPTRVARLRGDAWRNSVRAQLLAARDLRLLSLWHPSYLAALFERHGGNVSAIAREAGLNRNHVAELAVKLGLKSK
jgi:hypothetical protein